MDANESKLKIMKEDNISKVLLKLGLPTMIGMLVTALYSIIDAFSVGGLGTSQMGAVAIAFPIVQIIYEQREYEIISVFQGRVLYQDEEGFRYYRYGGDLEEAQFHELMEGVHERDFILQVSLPHTGSNYYCFLPVATMGTMTDWWLWRSGSWSRNESNNDIAMLPLRKARGALQYVQHHYIYGTFTWNVRSYRQR